MRIIFICLFIISSVALYAQTPIIVSDSTQAPVQLDCREDKPLYILNNIIVPCDSVRFIKPDEILEIQVLKGASAAALYGAIAAKNGTVAITTKKYAASQKKISEQKSEIKKP